MKIVNHLSAGIVLYRYMGCEKEYLLLQYPQGHWDFAKGHVEEGENLKDAAVRELEEETGLSNVEILDGFLVPMFYEYKQDGDLHKKKVEYFVGKLVGEKDIVLSHEHIGFDWQNFDGALKLLTFDNAKDILIAAESFLKFAGVDK